MARPIPELVPLTYSVPQAAAVLGVSGATAWRLVQSGDLPVVRIGSRVLVGRARLEQWVAEHSGDHLLADPSPNTTERRV